ncbi:MAG: hypothetical protein AAF709_15300 [Pseudomonadota bacterium]
MSGPCIHYLIARELRHHFEPLAGEQLNGKSFADILKDNPVHVSVGAQGPDFLFFLLSDILGTAGGTPANELGGRLARATLDTSAQIEELNARLFEAHPILENLIAEKARFDALADDAVEKSISLSALRDGVAAMQQVLDF